MSDVFESWLLQVEFQRTHNIIQAKKIHECPVLKHNTRLPELQYCTVHKVLTELLGIHSGRDGFIVQVQVGGGFHMRSRSF